MELDKIEVVEDRTAQSRCDVGFLRLRRLILRNRYEDGSASQPYNCDIVTRRQPDAVAIVLYEQDASGEIRVLLRRGIRAPIVLRQEMDHRGRDEPVAKTIYELVAGVLEDEDIGYPGVDHRACEEAREEAGLAIGAADVASLGGSFFPSPGITPEKVYLARCRADLDDRGEAEGDGSVMEEGATAEVFELREAIRMCRRGEIQDAKTEIGLLRLADALGYIPQLGCFVEDLPEPLRSRYDRLGEDAPEYC